VSTESSEVQTTEKTKIYCNYTSARSDGSYDFFIAAVCFRKQYLTTKFVLANPTFPITFPISHSEHYPATQ